MLEKLNILVGALLVGIAMILLLSFVTIIEALILMSILVLLGNSVTFISSIIAVIVLELFSLLLRMIKES